MLRICLINTTLGLEAWNESLGPPCTQEGLSPSVISAYAKDSLESINHAGQDAGQVNSGVLRGPYKEV